MLRSVRIRVWPVVVSGCVRSAGQDGLLPCGFARLFARWSGDLCGRGGNHLHISRESAGAVPVGGSVLTDLQRQKIERRFALLDVDHSGFLEESDYTEMARRVTSNLSQHLGGTVPPDAEARVHGAYTMLWTRLRDRMDSDGDGRISQEEFVASVAHSITERPGGYDRVIAPIIDAVMAIIDANNDGQISEAEFQTWITAYGVSELDAGTAFLGLDADGSGFLSREEMQQAFRDFYCAAETTAAGNALFGQST